MFIVNGRTTAQFGEIPAIGLLPQSCAVAQDCTRHLGKPGCKFGLEMTVPLVYRRILPNVLQGLPRKAAEILVLAHLGVVNVALTTDPLQQGLFLCRSGITAKAIADLHTG